MNPTEPKPQTPLTDAIYMRCRDLVGCDTHTDYDIFIEMTEHARSLELKLQEAENHLRLIGDMAVVDWDDTTVGKVDAVVKGQPPQTYIDKVRNLYKRAQEAYELELKLKEAERQRDVATAELELWRDGNIIRQEDKAERDQLIKVVDDLGEGLRKTILWGECCSMRLGESRESINWTYLNDGRNAYNLYSLLPHVQAKKGIKI